MNDDNMGYILLNGYACCKVKKNLLIKKYYDESESEDDIDVDDI